MPKSNSRRELVPQRFYLLVFLLESRRGLIGRAAGPSVSCSVREPGHPAVVHLAAMIVLFIGDE